MIEPELLELLDEVSDGNLTTGQRAADLYDKLSDARQAHRPWANRLLRDATLAGLQSVIKKHMKARAVVKVKARPEPTSTIIGVPSSVDGRIVWHQKAMSDVTWVELGDYLDMLRANQRAINRNVKQIKALLELRDQAPGSCTVGQALGTLHTTIEEVLAA